MYAARNVCQPPMRRDHKMVLSHMRYLNVRLRSLRMFRVPVCIASVEPCR